MPILENIPNLAFIDVGFIWICCAYHGMPFQITRAHFRHQYNFNLMLKQRKVPSVNHLNNVHTHLSLLTLFLLLIHSSVGFYTLFSFIWKYVSFIFAFSSFVNTRSIEKIEHFCGMKQYLFWFPCLSNKLDLWTNPFILE